jgi:hypothetical protein
MAFVLAESLLCSPMKVIWFHYALRLQKIISNRRVTRIIDFCTLGGTQQLAFSVTLRFPCSTWTFLALLVTASDPPFGYI